MKLPVRVADLAKLAARKNSNFAIGGVQLVSLGDGTFTVSATDTKTLLTVSGKANLEATDELGRCEAIVASAAWSRAIKTASGVNRYAEQNERKVGVSVGEGSVTFTSANPARELTEVAKTMAGRFPPVEQIVLDSSASLLELTFDPKRFANLLTVVAAVMGPGATAVLEFHGAGKPLQIRARNDELRATGLLMPNDLSDAEKSKEANYRDEMEVEELKANLLTVAAERDYLLKSIQPPNHEERTDR